VKKSSKDTNYLKTLLLDYLHEIMIAFWHGISLCKSIAYLLFEKCLKGTLYAIENFGIPFG
jgi:hypothetical protein